MVASILLTRLAVDTLEANWQRQGWIGLLLGYDQHFNRKLMRHQEYLEWVEAYRQRNRVKSPLAIDVEEVYTTSEDVYVGLWQWYAIHGVEFPPFGTITAQYSWPVVFGLRWNLYAQEPLAPVLYVSVGVVIAGTMAVVGIILGHRYLIEKAAFTWLRESTNDPRGLTANHLEGVPVFPGWGSQRVSRSVIAGSMSLPVMGIVAWYVAFDRTGYIRHYGTPIYTSIYWNVITWGLWLSTVSCFYLRTQENGLAFEPRCLKCDYCLEALQTARCPECGAPKGTTGFRWGRSGLRATLGMVAAIASLSVMLGVNDTLAWNTPVASTVLGNTYSSNTVEQVPVIPSTFADRVKAWGFMSPVAPVRIRATFIGGIILGQPSTP